MTLTEISYHSRRMAPFAIVAVLIVFIFYYLFRILFLYVGSSSNVPVQTDTIFNVIKPPKIVNSLTPGKLNYTLDTIEGSPVTATPSAKVYFVPKPSTRFGFREKITLMAQSLGIDTIATKYKLVGQEAQFIDNRNTFNVDIASFNFDYEYKLESDPALFDNVRVPDADEVRSEAIDFLRNFDRYPQDLAQGKANIVYLRYDPATSNVQVVENPEEANMVEADFYRPDIEGFPVVSSKYFNSQNYVVMVFGERDLKIVKAQVKHFDISSEQVGLYPLKSGEQAYQKLQSGDAIFINVPVGQQDITIKKMFLGYLDPEIYQEYMQPVYVFLGDNNFVAYVPAVADEYLDK